jgi:hypothetical protein
MQTTLMDLNVQRLRYEHTENDINDKIVGDIIIPDVKSLLLHGSESSKVTSAITSEMEVVLCQILRIRYPEVMTNQQHLKVTQQEKVVLHRPHTGVCGLNNLVREVFSYNTQGRRTMNFLN